MNLNEWANEIHQNAVNHGFWEPKPDFNTSLMLIVGELAEAMEEHRAGRPMEYKKCIATGDVCIKMPVLCDGCMAHRMPRKPEGIAVEMIDALIRILDWCGAEGLDVERLVQEKHKYNKSRPYKHGKRY